MGGTSLLELADPCAGCASVCQLDMLGSRQQQRQQAVVSRATHLICTQRVHLDSRSLIH